MVRIINDKVAQNIGRVAAVADQIPGVVVIHHLPTFTVSFMSEKGLRMIGKSLDEVVGMTSEDYHREFFNAEDAQDYVPKILDLISRNVDDEIFFFQQVRNYKTGAFDWYLSGVRILMRDDNNEPLLIITTAMQIDPKHHLSSKVSRLLEENNFLKANVHRFSKLTGREKEVLRLIALGNTAHEVATDLHIAAATVETHRKNIKKKLGTASNYDLSLYARAFDLI